MNFSQTTFLWVYSELLVPIKLRNNSTPQLSHINIADTDSCFINGIGSDWSSYSNSNGDEVIFDITKEMAAISFQNFDTSSTDCGSNGSGSSTNRIRFTFTPPNNANSYSKCAYAELFTIVVNAYAGEQIGFVVDSTHIIYRSRGGTPCQPINSETSGPRCGFINSSVSYPDTLSTVNDDLLANFSTITSNNDGSESFSILIKNNGASSITVNYVEFTLTASLSNAVMTFSGIAPQVYPGSLGTQLLHYIIPIAGGVSIGAGASASVCTITIAQNGLNNMGWSYNFTFQGIMATRPKTRISSSSGCTALNTTTKSMSGNF